MFIFTFICIKPPLQFISISYNIIEIDLSIYALFNSFVFIYLSLDITRPLTLLFCAIADSPNVGKHIKTNTGIYPASTLRSLNYRQTHRPAPKLEWGTFVKERVSKPAQTSGSRTNRKQPEKLIQSAFAPEFGLLSHQRTWKCTGCRKTTFLLERAYLHFHVAGRVRVFGEEPAPGTLTSGSRPWRRRQRLPRPPCLVRDAWCCFWHAVRPT